MKKRVVAIVMAMSLAISMFGCGSTTSSENNKNAKTSEEKTADDSEKDELDTLSEVETEKNLFSVELKIPADYVEKGTTQESLDAVVAEKGYKSATLNDDGSVTYVMTKKQHKSMMEELKKSLEEALAKIPESEEYSTVKSIENNDDFTDFTVTTTNSEASLNESFLVMALYMYGGTYAVFNGEKVDNIHVSIVNADSGEVVNEANSRDLGEE